MHELKVSSTHDDNNTMLHYGNNARLIQQRNSQTAKNVDKHEIGAAPSPIMRWPYRKILRQEILRNDNDDVTRDLVFNDTVVNINSLDDNSDCDIDKNVKQSKRSSISSKERNLYSKEVHKFIPPAQPQLQPRCPLQTKIQQNSHDTFLNSIFCLLPCNQLSYHNRFRLLDKQPEKCTLQYSPTLAHKLWHYLYKDLINILCTLLLIMLLPQLILQLPAAVKAGCRDEPSRSCEAICRPGWLKADNHNHYDAMHHLANSDNDPNDTLTVFSSSSSRPMPSLIAYNCTIRALVLLPDNDMYLTSLRSVVPILKVAEQHVHESGLLPPYIRFDWMPQDDKCDAAFAVVKAMDGIVKNCAHVVFGPTCDYSLAAVGRIAKYFNSNGTPLISIGGSTYDFEKQKTTCADEFYMLLRTGMLSFETISELTISVMKRHKWSRSILFYDRNGQHNVAGLHTCFLMMNSLGNQMRMHNMTFAQYPITAKSTNRTEEMIREIGNKHSIKSD